MKKIILNSITLLMLTSLLSPNLISAAPSSQASWKMLYSAYLKKYLSNSDNFYGDDEFVTLVDLDRNGIPELILGSSYQTVNRVDLAVTVQKGKVVPLKENKKVTDSESIFNVGMAGFIQPGVNFTPGIMLYQHKTTKKHVFIMGDGYDTGLSNGESWSEVTLQGTIITFKNLFGQSEDEGDYYYQVKGKEVGEKEYNQAKAAYFSSMKQVPSDAFTMNMSKIFSSLDNTFVPNGVSIFMASYGKK